MISNTMHLAVSIPLIRFPNLRKGVGILVCNTHMKHTQQPGFVLYMTNMGPTCTSQLFLDTEIYWRLEEAEREKIADK